MYFIIYILRLEAATNSWGGGDKREASVRGQRRYRYLKSILKKCDYMYNKMLVDQNRILAKKLYKTTETLKALIKWYESNNEQPMPGEVFLKIYQEKMMK